MKQNVINRKYYIKDIKTEKERKRREIVSSKFLLKIIFSIIFIFRYYAMAKGEENKKRRY